VEQHLRFPPECDHEGLAFFFSGEILLKGEKKFNQKFPNEVTFEGLNAQK
jgi:hypothetical protein